MSTIILASASPRRKKLLQKIHLSFEVRPSSASESFDPALAPADVVQQLALRKARDITRQPRVALVIGADTIVCFGDQILEKPAGPTEAKQMLEQLNGKSHQVLTGVALCKVDSSYNITDQTTFCEQTDVIFGDLDPQLIAAYIKTGGPMDKAGGYGIQDSYGPLFVRRIEGDYYNVVGFPLHRFYTTMKTFAPEFLPSPKLDGEADA